MNLKSEKDFFSGLVFMVAGVAFAWAASSYSIGSATQMGSGYFPLILGIVLVLIGAAVCFMALVIEREGGGKIGAWAWRPLFFVTAANLAFGLLLVGLPAFKLPAAGLVVAVYALTFLASLAQAGARFKTTLALASVLAGCSYLVFVFVLDSPLTVWPPLPVN
jgi:hypothetical protein